MSDVLTKSDIMDITGVVLLLFFLVGVAVTVAIIFGIAKFRVYIRSKHKEKQELEKVAPENTPQIDSEYATESPVMIKPIHHFEKSELFLEIETNIATAKNPFTGKLLPFQTNVWDRSLYEIDILPANTLKELHEAYTDIRVTNELVWLSEVVGHIGKGMEGSYLKLCTSIADRLDRVMLQITS